MVTIFKYSKAFIKNRKIYGAGKRIINGADKMKKKIIILTAISIILWAGVAPISATFEDFQPMNTGLGRGTLYVGGTGPSNYTTIQEAITDATNDDTIFVFNGTYNENINIPKRLNIIGEDRDTTIINGVAGEDAVVLILLGQVEISDFTIQGDSSGQDGIQVVSLMQNVVINHNIIKDCAYGILLQVTTESETISSNIITDNDFAGIQLQESDRNNIINNVIENNGGWGISLNSLSKQNNIVENFVSNNNGGIHLSLNSEQNEITDNVISDNSLEGLLIEGLSGSNTIERNNIINNLAGIKISGGSHSNVINGNNIENNSIEGLLFESSNTNTITNNNFIGNARHAKYRFSSRNVWDANYWDNWIGFIFESPIFQSFPKIIKGIFLVNIDANPALEPYEI